MASDNQWFQMILPWLAQILFLDLFFGGLTLRLLGMGTWYKGLSEGERVTYRGWFLCLKGGSWNGRVIITNKRFVVTLLFSWLAVVDVPLETIREVVPGKWWWFQTVRVAYKRNGRERSIGIASNRRGQAELLQCFRSIGARIVGD